MHYENFNDLEDRLINFACMCFDVCDLLPKTRAIDNLESQLSKSATTCVLLYIETITAQSKSEFIRKMKIALKEMLTSRIILRIIKQKPVTTNERVGSTLTEADQLLSIFINSIETTQGKRSIKGEK